ncbi:MAG: adenylate/guanylate cyclase domain-containing protein [Paracoccaceae bacterium]|nr:adenylate/guanylate cyclase domain-containing protein [Paracoccaceae bacterium]
MDKFVGDSIMAFWSAPIEIRDHSEKGLRAALQLREELARFNALQENNDNPHLEIAVGLSSGMACVGNIVSNQRFSYTAIGKTVNLAARVEAACRQINYDIVCSEITANSSGYACLSAGKLSLKGFSEPISLYIVVGDENVANSSAFKTLESLHIKLVEHLKLEKPYEEILDQCIQLSTKIEHGLGEFYISLHERKGEFKLS